MKHRRHSGRPSSEIVNFSNKEQMGFYGRNGAPLRFAYRPVALNLKAVQFKSGFRNHHSRTIRFCRERRLSRGGVFRVCERRYLGKIID